eukprot:TRINITY_DN26967_c0_g1_i1.p1 TRINITY_DN26967_c0_g1~~TRINITY_DN26967_c0_g1_i1.p1  ORF type:complete len:725 (-),score=100.73 TRINITY_DN26967_c0_g1_i1:120-2081(-)
MASLVPSRRTSSLGPVAADSRDSDRRDLPAIPLMGEGKDCELPRVAGAPLHCFGDTAVLDDGFDLERTDHFLRQTLREELDCLQTYQQHVECLVNDGFRSLDTKLQVLLERTNQEPARIQNQDAVKVGTACEIVLCHPNGSRIQPARNNLNGRLKKKEMAPPEESPEAETPVVQMSTIVVEEEHPPKRSKASKRQGSRRSRNTSALSFRAFIESELRAMKDGNSKSANAPEGKVATMVAHPKFDGFIVCVVLFNSVLVGLQIQHQAIQDEPFPPFELAEYMCSMVFLIELILRMAALKSFCSRPNRLWSCFDVTLVCMSLIDFAFTKIMESITIPSAGSSVGKIVKVARVARVMRILRMVRFLARVRIMVAMIVGSMTALFWLFVLIFSVMYVFAIILTQGATDWRKPDDREWPMRDDLYIEVDTCFGSVPHTMYSLFQAMTGGRSWGEFAVLTWPIGWIYTSIFFFYIFFTFFSVLNIVTGVFVDGAIQQANSDRSMRIKKESEATAAFVEDLHELLEVLDKDGDGMISSLEWERGIGSMEVRSVLSALEIETTDVMDLFELLDADGDRTVSIGELVEGIQKVKGPAQSIQMHVLLSRINKLYKYVVSKEEQLSSYTSAQDTRISTPLLLQHSRSNIEALQEPAGHTQQGTE